MRRNSVYFRTRTGLEYYFETTQKLRAEIFSREKIHFPSLLMGIEKYYGEIVYMKINNIRLI